VPEDGLGSSERFPHVAEQRGVRVSEAVPGNQRQLQIDAHRTQYAAEQVLGVEWSLRAGGEDEIF